MLSVDLIQVAILWCIAGLAIIGSISIRGFFRALVSWLVTIAIATVAIFFSYVKSVTVKQQIGLEDGTLNSRAVFVSDSGLNFGEGSNASRDSIATNYVATEKQLLEHALAISDSILAFPKRKSINAQGIEKLELFESKALSLRNKSMDIYRQVRSIQPLAEGKAYHDLLLAAVDNLRLAGYEIHHQFGEQDNAGESLNRAAIHAAQAKGALLQLKEQL
ncbi:MAG: hypothetical protein LBH25_04890 [Fibromonadaceae bacterium]|jgi:hypothetical protein|nr:hypothetical protein [Fibromonadaceae bacterium]